MESTRRHNIHSYFPIRASVFVNKNSRLEIYCHTICQDLTPKRLILLQILWEFSIHRLVVEQARHTVDQHIIKMFILLSNVLINTENDKTVQPEIYKFVEYKIKELPREVYVELSLTFASVRLLNQPICMPQNPDTEIYAIKKLVLHTFPPLFSVAPIKTKLYIKA